MVTDQKKAKYKKQGSILEVSLRDFHDGVIYKNKINISKTQDLAGLIHDLEDKGVNWSKAMLVTKKKEVEQWW